MSIARRTGIKRVAFLASIILATTGLARSTSPDALGQSKKPQVRWLAAGDSFSSGRGISGSFAACGRATAWGPLAKESLVVSGTIEVTAFDHVACSGARVKGKDDSDTNTWSLQAGLGGASGNAPYNLVTFTFGGNDLGFDEKLSDCFWQPRCPFDMKKLTKDINDFKPDLEAFYESLLKDSSLLTPTGHIVAAGYPFLFESPQKWSFPANVIKYCWRFHPDDVKMINDGIKQVNSIIKAVADKYPKRFHYVNVNDPKRDSFLRHGVCSKQAEWINHPRWPDEKGSIHLNQDGENYYAKKVAEQVKNLRFGALPPPAAQKPPLQQQQQQEQPPLQQQPNVMIPAAPTELSAEAICPSTFRMTWTDNANDETGFRIYDRVPGIVEDRSASSGTGQVRWTKDWGTYLGGSQHRYSVAAYNSAGESPRSNEVFLSRDCQPATPTTAPPGDSFRRFEVYATQDQPGLNTGIRLTAGQFVAIHAEGVATYGYDPSPCGDGSSTTPDGHRTSNGTNCDAKYDNGAVARDRPIGSLIACVASTGSGCSGRWTGIGDSCFGFKFSESGVLFLLYNDVPGQYGNNGGRYQVTVSNRSAC